MMVLQVTHEEILRYAAIRESGEAFIAARAIHCRVLHNETEDGVYEGFHLTVYRDPSRVDGFCVRVPTDGPKYMPSCRGSIRSDILNGMQSLEYVCGGGEL